MKKFIGLLSVFGLIAGMPIKSHAQADDHIRLRVGLSYVSGLVGLEYQKNNIAASVGWTTPLKSPSGGDSLQRLFLGARYFQSPDANGLFGALSFGLNADGEETYDDDLNIVNSGYNALYATAGYRFLFADRFDFTIGAGYGTVLGLPEVTEVESGTLSIDLTLGFAIK